MEYIPYGIDNSVEYIPYGIDNSVDIKCQLLYRTLQCLPFGPTNFIGTTTSTARMTVYALDEDFYGGRTGPLEKLYLFIYFLLI